MRGNNSGKDSSTSGCIAYRAPATRSTVDVDALVDETQAIAGQRDNAFHKVLRGVHRVMEYDNVAPLHFAVGQQPIQDSTRPP